MLGPGWAWLGKAVTARRIVIAAAVGACLHTGAVSAQTWNAERAQPDTPSTSTGLPSVPNIDAMTPDQRDEYFRQMDHIVSGSSDSDTDALLRYKNGDTGGASTTDDQYSPTSTEGFTAETLRGFEASENPYESGDAGYTIGCLADAVIQPENGGCLENPINKRAYDAARDLNGDGVRTAPDYSQYLPLPDAAQPEDATDSGSGDSGGTNFDAYLPSP